MKRSARLNVEVIPTPGTDALGKPYTVPSFRFWDTSGVSHEGCAQLADVARAMGIELKPGDLIRVTIEFP